MRALAVALWLSVMLAPVALIALGEHNREALATCQLTHSADVCNATLR